MTHSKLVERKIYSFMPCKINSFLAISARGFNINNIFKRVAISGRSRVTQNSSIVSFVLLLENT